MENDNRGESRPESNSGRTDVQTALNEMMSAAERARDELLYAHRRACFLLFVTRNEGGPVSEVEGVVETLEEMTEALLALSIADDVARGGLA